MGRLELVTEVMGRMAPPVVTLLTLAYLLRGDRVVADAVGISRVGASAAAGGRGSQARGEGDGG